jgi:diaminopimelate epimerase
MKKIKFLKMHGLGNDFVIFYNEDKKLHDETFVRKISNRKTGIGCDLVAFVDDSKSKFSNLEVTFFNSDGSKANTCGNALRCIGKNYFDNNKVQNLVVDTDSGLIDIQDYGNGNISVDMGKPKFDCESIPISSKTGQNEAKINLSYLKGGIALNVGNPHLIFFVDKIDKRLLEKNSQEICKLNIFPDGVNISAVKIVDKSLIKVLTHERGVGITDACGSGACASFAVGNLLNYVQRKVCVEMKGGNLNIEFSKDKHIIMIGKAKKVFEGTFMLS